MREIHFSLWFYAYYVKKFIAFLNFSHSNGLCFVLEGSVALSLSLALAV